MNIFTFLWQKLRGVQPATGICPNCRRKSKAAEIDRILFLYLDGQPISRISRITGVSTGKVLNAIKRHHLLQVKDGGTGPNPRL
jgi:hypothetical protein